MKTGVISWCDKNKGFGFLKPDDKSKDVFFHANDLKKINLDNIESKTKISFETREDKNNRIYAFNLNLI